jgi:hypothetical protein
MVATEKMMVIASPLMPMTVHCRIGESLPILRTMPLPKPEPDHLTLESDDPFFG